MLVSKLAAHSTKKLDPDFADTCPVCSPCVPCNAGYSPIYSVTNVIVACNGHQRRKGGVDVCFVCVCLRAGINMCTFMGFWECV